MARTRAVLPEVVLSRRGVRILAFAQGLATFLGFGLSPARADEASPSVPIISALGSPRSVGQAPSAGAISEQFDIDVSPGRHDVRPRLSLIYASLGALADSGLGWSLTPGKIERSTIKGVPRLDATDTFVFSLNTSTTELVAVGGGKYRAKTESDYREFTFDGNTWQMRLPQGVIYRFGNTSDSHVGASSWMLSAIEDRNGNTVRYLYSQDAGTAYLAEIDYTGNSATGDLGANKILFNYEARPDVRVSYALAERRTRSQRLAGISEFAGSQLVRRFALSYQPSPDSGVSLLTGIALIGDDGGASVNARTYQYSHKDLGWQADSVGTLPFPFYDSSGKDLGVRTADVNGDNRVDLVRNGTEVWLGDGTGHFAKDAGWSASLAAIGASFVNGDGLDQGVRLVDINGDFRPDVVIASPSNHQVFLNTGTGWLLDPTYTASVAGLTEDVLVPVGVLNPDASCDGGCGQLIADPISFSFIDTSHDSRGVYLTDVNGDGLTDIVWSYRNTTMLQNFVTDAGVINRTPLELRAVFLNTGSGFVRDDARSLSLTSPLLDPFVIDTQIQGYDLVDVNGDGLPDIVRTLQSKTPVVLLNNGHGWELDAGFSDSLAANPQILSYSSDFKNLGLTPADLNGDGLIDYIRADSGTRAAFRNTGTGWVSDPTLTALLDQADLRLVDSSNATSGDLFADVDGDNLPDLLLTRSDSPLTIRLAPHGIINFLSRAVSGLGETTDLAYAPSSTFNNVGSDGLQDLPMVIPVCTSLTRSDGRGHSFVDSYSYAGGAIVDGVFRGFATSDATDSLGTRLRSVFSQSGATSGNLLRTETTDSGGALRARHSLTYSTATPLVGVTQLMVTQTDEELFDGPATVHTRVHTAYDAFLNIVEVVRDGNVATAGDEARTVIEHTNNPASGMFDPVWRLSVFDLAGHLLSRTTTLYDNLPPGQIGRGNPTKVKDQVDASGAEVVRTMDYDQFGNIVAATDRNGNRTRFFYDAGASTFRERVVDPLGHVFKTTHDPRFGVVVRNVDANGEATVQSYDAFGRLVRTVEPGDEASPNGTKTITYSPIGDPTQQSVTVSQTETPGRPDTLDTESFVDGFGQVYRLESEGGGGRTIVLTTDYDEYGSPSQATVPHFSTDPAPTTSYERDARRRITRVTFPDGLSETTVYLGTEKDTVDRQGHAHRTISDGYGSVTEIHDLTTSGDRTTLFQYDLFGNVIRTQNADGEITRIGYDFLGRRTFLDDPTTGRSQYGYDAAGNIVSQLDAAGRRVSLKYDALGRLVEKRLTTNDTTCPKNAPACEVSGGHAQIVYRFQFDDPHVPDSIGRVTSFSDEAGTVTVRYDGRGDVIERHRRLPGGPEYVTGYAYDSMKRQRGVFYPDGYVLRTSYNEAGLPVRIDDEDGKAVVESVSYSALGRPTALVFGNGTTTTETYDALQRLSTLQTAGNGEVVQNRAYAYDPGSNITGITDLAFGRSQSFAYDELNRLVHAEGPYGVEDYRYDALGNLLQKGSLRMNYDSVHRQRLVCGVDASANTSAFRQDFKKCFGRLPTMADLTGADTSSHVPTFFATYDPIGNLVQRGNAHYAYDTENRLLSTNGGSGSSGEINVYDANGTRVIRQAKGEETVTIDGLFEADDDRSLKHVTLGHMLVATIVRPTSQTRLATKVVFAGDIPQLEAYAGSDQPGMSCGVTVGHGAPLDLGFVLVLGPAWAFSLVGRRRVTAAVRRVGRFFRGVGRRVLARPGSTGIVLLLVVLQLLGGRSGGAAQPPTLQDTRFYYHTDHISSVQAITDQSGHVVRRQDYKPFGEQIDLNAHLPGAPSDLDRSYQSKELDPTQLYYFGARHYDPVIGRFLTADSLIGDPSDGAQHHRYVFSLNNPIRYSDPTGHNVLDVILGVVLVVLLVVVAIILLIVPGTEPLGAFLGAVAVGALIGGFAGAVIGGVIAFTLLAEGKISLLDAFRLWSASMLIGMLAGAAIGAIYAGGILAAAAATEHIISGALIGAAVGATVGGSIGAAKGGSFGDDFLRGLLMGALIGAIVGGFIGEAAPGFATQIVTFANGLGATLGASATAVLVPSLIAGGAALGAAAGVFAYYCVKAVGGPCLFAGENPLVKDANKEMPPASSFALVSTPVTN